MTLTDIYIFIYLYRYQLQKKFKIIFKKKCLAKIVSHNRKDLNKIVQFILKFKI